GQKPRRLPSGRKDLHPSGRGHHARPRKHIRTGDNYLGVSELPLIYLSFFSRFPSMSNSCFLPPKSEAPFPLSLSLSIVSLYSIVILLSMNSRTAENVRLLSFSFTSLSFVSFWSGQLIVPASLSPSFLIIKVDIRFCPPIS